VSFGHCRTRKKNKELLDTLAATTRDAEEALRKHRSLIQEKVLFNDTRDTTLTTLNLPSFDNSVYVGPFPPSLS